jgi:hypothetical protein
MPERIEYRACKDDKGEPLPIAPVVNSFHRAAEFLAALRATEHAMSTDETRLILNGWAIETGGATGCTVIATDGRRLCKAAAGVSSSDAAPDTFVLQSALASLLWLFDGADYIDITRQGATEPGGVVTLSHPGTGARVTLRAVAGRYPDWRQVVPDVAWSHLACTVAKSDVIEGCKGALAMCDRDTVRNCASLLCDGWIGSEGAATAIDGLTVSVPVPLNANYLLDAVSAIAGDSVTVHTLYYPPAAADYRAPVCITSDGTFEVLMPMRTDCAITAENWNIPADVDLTAKQEPAMVAPVEIGKVA